MTAYTKSTNFATKDTLTSGDPLKIVKGTEINTEFDNIATAVNSKSDTASPTFTGTVTIPILAVTGASTLTGVATLTAQPILSSLTASSAVATDASKGLVSVTNTGTGNNVLATSPTLVTPILGTPTSGTVTNLTGTASININGTVGATTANTGAFTTLSATGVTTVQAGTAALPAITTTGDTNTGIFFPAADTIAFTEGGAEAMRIDSSGNVIVGGASTSSDESTYQGGGVFVSRRASSAGTTHANFLNGGSLVGSITSNTTTTFYNTTSDYRLKENATPVTTGLQTIAALNPVNFDWVSNRIADTGFLAHEFQSVIPNSVMGTKDAIDASGNPVYQQIDRSGAIPFLVAAIQEQQALITALTARITALEAK